MIKLLQVCDLCLDAPFSYLNWEKRQQRNAEREAAFSRMTELALEERVRAVLLLGKIFANQFVSEKTINLVNTKLDLLKENGIDVIIVPEKGKSLNPLYNNLKGKKGVYFFSGFNWQKIFFPDDELHFYCCQEKDSFRSRTLGKLRIKEKTGWHIGLYLGHFSSSELEKTNLDYLALGQYAHYLQKNEGIKAGYPGSLEGYEFQKQEQGYVFLLQLQDKEVKVIPKKIGVKETIEVAYSNLKSESELYDKIKLLADRNLLLRVVLTGKAQSLWDIDKLTLDLANEFFFLEIEDLREQQYSSQNESLAQIFKALWQEKLQAADSVLEQKRLNQALALGMRSLRRGEVKC